MMSGSTLSNAQDIHIWSELNHTFVTLKLTDEYVHSVCVSLQKAYEVDTCAEVVYVRACISAPKEMDKSRRSHPVVW